jgi:ABC-type transport system substrate-binding protein/class 3 adenylate cyclase
MTLMRITASRNLRRPEAYNSRMSVPMGERRVVSVLVADVAASTAIGERLGPERSKFLFDEIARLMQEEVERFGGTVAQLTGDGVLALFGAPVAHEDDSERAVRTGIAIREALARYDEEVGPAYGIELGARVAVNTGPVVVPARDEPPDRLYNALGDTVNVAARLQSHGDLVVGPETARQLGDRFLLESLGELELKGKSTPTVAYRVAGEREAPTQAAATPLVGRESELARLEEVLGELVEGRGAIVVLTGEPGIGKSRLKTEARERFHERVRFVEGHAVSYAAEIPYWPVRDLLRDWLALGVSEPEARMRLELRAGVTAALGDEADEAYPFIASMLGLSLEPELERRLHELSRDSVRQQTFDATYRLVCALAQEQPLCLVLEDLHWADEATTALVEALLPASEDAVAIVLSFRAEGDHPALDLADRARRRYRHRFLELELEPLSPDAARELAVATAQAELPEQVADLLAERSGGNPFFLEEALRDLIERGVLRRLNGGFELADGDRIAVPTLVQEALQARLDRLPREARNVVMTAAVVGRSFEMPLLERLIPAVDLRPALSELQQLELVVEESRRPAPQYRFRHGLVQEVAYRRLVEAQRRELHRAVGDALEELHRDSPEEVLGLLARHYSEAHEPERAVEYLLKAGDAARALYADEEALELYGRALEFMERTDEARARETLLKVALTHHLAFDFRAARQAYDRAFTQPAPRPRRLEPREHLRAGSFGLPQFGFVPGISNDHVSVYLARHLYRGLVAVGRELELVPDLADRFSVSNDGRTYRFHIRPDAHWSDGVRVSAGDFAFSWSRMREDEVQTAFYFENVAAAEAVDAQTLEIRLREPRNYFLYLLAQPPLYAWPRHLYERLGRRWFESAPLVGNGPFVLVELSEDAARLEASEAWSGPRGNVQSIDVDFIGGSAKAMVARWQERRYDVLPLAINTGATFEDAVVESASGLATTYLAFRTDRQPFADVRVRSAFAHAVDRNRLLAAWGVAADPATRSGFIPPAMPGHSHRVAPGYDPERARDLLAEAGYFQQQRDPVVIAEFETTALLGADLVAQLDAVGVTVDLRDLPFIEIDRVVERGDAWLTGWIADYPDPDGMLEPFLASYHALYRDRVVEQVLERARSLPHRDERLELYREAERAWLGEQVALVPLAYGRQLSVRRPWIDGLWANAFTVATLDEAVVHGPQR